jgi:hypothetical protein
MTMLRVPVHSVNFDGGRLKRSWQINADGKWRPVSNENGDSLQGTLYEPAIEFPLHIQLPVLDESDYDSKFSCNLSYYMYMCLLSLLYVSFYMCYYYICHYYLCYFLCY